MAWHRPDNILLDNASDFVNKRPLPQRTVPEHARQCGGTTKKALFSMIIYFKLTLTAIFWGGTFVAARAVSGHIGPFTGSFIRFAAASLLLAVMALAREGRLPTLGIRQVFPALLLGMTGVFAYNVFFFSGLQTITAGRASLIVAMNPAVISLLSALFFHEKLHAAKIAGALACLSGVVLVISRGNPLSLFQGGLGAGEFFILGCVASWVAYSLIGKAVMKHLTPFAAVFYSCAIGAAALFPLALLENMAGTLGNLSMKDWSALLYLAIFGTVAGFYWYYEGIEAIGAARASVFINLVPVSGVFLGWLLLAEPVNISIIAGAALVVGGISLTNMLWMKS
jgi:drug/metabolite transporter (DMT)-like permease